MGRVPRTLRCRHAEVVLLFFPLLALLVPLAPAQAIGFGPLRPSAIAYDAAGNLFIADSGRHQVFEATLAGSLLVVAGNGTQGFAGDGGPATAAQLNRPEGVAVGADGTLYIADTGNGRVRKVFGGNVSTLAGTGQHAFVGDGGLAASASFRAPAALALDSKEGLLICDTADHRVRRVDLQAGLVSTIAGTGVQGYTGDGGAAVAAELDSPQGVAVDGGGQVFIADTHNQRIRAISTAGIITTYAGTGIRGFGGDGGPAVSAQLAEPHGVILAANGTLWIGDEGNRRVRQVSPAGVITTLGGSGVEGSGSDGEATEGTAFRTPRAMALSSFGLPAVADTLNGTVRLFTAAGPVFRPAALATGRTGSAIYNSLATTQVYGSLVGSLDVSGPVGTPQGMVTIAEGGSSLASVSLQDGSATVGAGLLAAGSHSLTVAYGGDGLNTAASGGPFLLTITPLTITAVADSAAVVYGTATPALTGVLQGVLAADAGRVNAKFTVAAGTLAPVGTYPISATLTGTESGNYAVNMGANSGSLRITPAPSSTQLSTVATGYAGLPLRFAANVASSSQGQPTGTVQFIDGSAVVATAILVNGSASGLEVTPSAGTHSLSAVYSGDANFQPSSSAVQAGTISILPDFVIAADGASSQTVTAGSTATYRLLVGASPGPFTGDVTLAVNGLPAGAAATFSPVQVVPGTGSAGVTLTVLTPAAQAAVAGGRPAVWFGCLGVVGIVGVRRLRRSGRALSVMTVCLALTGCGARTVGEGTAGVTSKTYALTITGTSTNLLGGVVAHTTNATLIVQQ